MSHLTPFTVMDTLSLPSDSGYPPVSVLITGLLTGLLAGFLLLAAGCGGDGVTPPDSLRFGQIGEVRVMVASAVQTAGAAEAGALEESLTWFSDGRWRLEERILFEEIEGNGTVRTGNAGAGAYASLITHLNDVDAVQLFVEGLDPDLNPTCAPGRARISVRIRDDVRQEEREWTRCATGSLRTLSSVGAGPEEEATRVVVAAILTRDFSLGGSFTYSYTGSLPFRTLQKGADSGTLLDGPRAFRSESGTEPEGWSDLWTAHSNGLPLPDIDWVEEMVLVAAVGTVGEAGESVEVRRVLQVEVETLVEYVRRVPGDFCSPANVNHVPFHFVVAPRTVLQVAFSDVRIELVSCGG